MLWAKSTAMALDGSSARASHRGFYEAVASRGIVAGPRQEVDAALADPNNDGRLDMPVAYGLLLPDEVGMGPMPDIVIGDVLNLNFIRQPNALYVQDESGRPRKWVRTGGSTTTASPGACSPST